MMDRNNLYVCGNQFVLDCEYADYEDFLDMIPDSPGLDYSSETSAFNAGQYPMWRDPVASKAINHRQYTDDELVQNSRWNTAFEKLIKWTQKKLAANRIYTEIVPAVSWMMDYREHGWQTVHSHGRKCISQVLYTEASVDQTDDGKSFLHGAMFAFMNDGQPPFYRAFPAKAGQCIIIKGDVFHGVYPVKLTPRRCLVVDYLILQ
jgi:hypothetical protein